jgi:adenylate cyclase
MRAHRGLSLLYSIAIFVGFLVLTALLHLPHDVEHWSADFITSRFSTRPATQDPRIVLVYVSATTLAGEPYESPMDRGLLARLIDTIDKAGAAAIGLDIILDRYTEPDKDRVLRDVIHNTRAKLVVGAVKEPGSGRRVQNEFFLAGNGPHPLEAAYVYLDERREAFVVSDHVIRFIAESDGDEVPTPGGERIQSSFAGALARAAGSDFKPASHYIDWLLPPANGSENFLTLPAEAVLGCNGANLPLAQLLGGKIVLIGGNFDDRDQHLIPLSASRDDFFTGTFIHAQVLAQLLDRRSIYELCLVIEVLITVGAAFVGYWLGRQSGHYYLWLELAVVAGLLLIGIPVFLLFRLIFPYNVVLIAWLAGAAVGHYGRPEHPVAGKEHGNEATTT